MVTDHASLAANWGLFCPASWDDTTINEAGRAATVRARRARAGIPDDARHREKWRLALDMIDQMVDTWGLPKLPVVSDSGYGDCTAPGSASALTSAACRTWSRSDPTASAYPHDAVPVTAAYSGLGRPPRPAYPHPPSTLKDLALHAGRGALRQVTWRRGTQGQPDRGDALAVPGHPSTPGQPGHPRNADGSLPDCWLIAEWPPGTDEPIKYWPSNMDTRTPRKTLERRPSSR